ncbi:hypothetical protein M408DRAFT_10297 [Serendipita vermifera MAFF 305830]|uniref:Uncharacterized protein n=1 Tax=Serendipita vermifera MAFF 305830 TaxID=933852 RepID=A0A0C3B2D2_SERVB|nr:hypothetical protein M408DRAFT_10297 [Serendipita vermifera MAFF 305830]
MSQQSRPYIPLQTMGDGPQYDDPYNNMTADTSSTLLGKEEKQEYNKMNLLTELKRRTSSIFTASGEKLNLTEHESRYQDADYTALQDRLSSDGINSSDRIVYPELWYLKGSLVQFDQKTRLLSVKWSILWSQNGSEPQPFGEDNHRVLIGLYRDRSLREETASRLAALRKTAEKLGQSIGRRNTTEYAESYMKFAGTRIDDRAPQPVATLGIRSWDAAQTDISLQHAVTGSAWMTPSIALGFTFMASLKPSSLVGWYYRLCDRL